MVIFFDVQFFHVIANKMQERNLESERHGPISRISYERSRAVFDVVTSDQIVLVTDRHNQAISSFPCTGEKVPNWRREVASITKEFIDRPFSL